MTMTPTRIHPGGPEVSPLIYGVWRLADDPKGHDPARVQAKIEACLELGITSFDQADIYGDYSCEALFGAALKQTPSLREKIQLIAKCDICLISDKHPEHRVKHYNTSREHITASVENSLRLLHTETLELLLLHRPDPLMDADEVAETLTQLREQGKVQHFGVSNFTNSQQQLLASRLDFPLVSNQIELHLLHLDPLHDGTLDLSQQWRSRPMAWSPLAGGRLFTAQDERSQRVQATLDQLTKKYHATLTQLALAWVLKHPSQPIPILGTQKIDRIKEATRALDIQLDRQDWFALWSASTGHEVP